MPSYEVSIHELTYAKGHDEIAVAICNCAEAFVREKIHPNVAVTTTTWELQFRDEEEL